MRDKTAIVGIGASPYYFRGESLPRTKIELSCEAVIEAAKDAGIDVKDIDGFAYAAGTLDTNIMIQNLGIKELRFSAGLTGGGGGSVGTVQLAEAAILSGLATTVVGIIALQQPPNARFGGAPQPETPETSVIIPSGLGLPGQLYALQAQRHMYEYGTTRDHFAEVVMASRNYAMNRPKALRRKGMTLDDYFAQPMQAEPLCRYDFCLETDGAVAVIVTAADRAGECRQPPVYVTGSAQGGSGKWAKGLEMGMVSKELAASSGHRSLAPRLYEMAGIKPEDIDVALIYDHFAPLVLMQLEDYGICPIGKGGQYAAEGNLRIDGKVPVNPHGGNLSEAYILGMTHLKEAVEQLRGTAINQVKNAEHALVTGGPSSLPLTSLILRR